MTNKHLTDEEIQQYALDARLLSGSMAEHIQHCDHCRQQALHYQLTFEGLGLQEKAVFDFDLAELVMEQLPQTEPTYDRPLMYGLAAIIIVMIGLVAYVFGNSLVSLFAYLKPVLAGLVIITAIGLMAFLGLDMYQKYKAQMKRLSLY